MNIEKGKFLKIYSKNSISWAFDNLFSFNKNTADKQDINRCLES